jgi:hypothetical protein
MQSPGMSSRPCRLVPRTLQGPPADSPTGAPVIAYDVIGAPVRAYEVTTCRGRMPACKVCKGGWSPVLRSPEQELKIHHDVDQDRKRFLHAHHIPIRLQAADCRIIAFGQRVCRTHHDLPVLDVGRTFSQPKAVTETAHELESQIVRFRVGLLTFDGGRPPTRPTLKTGIAAEFICVPEAARVEPACPIVGFLELPCQLRSAIRGKEGSVTDLGDTLFQVSQRDVESVLNEAVQVPAREYGLRKSDCRMKYRRDENGKGVGPVRLPETQT